jgi:hypothetical protein
MPTYLLFGSLEGYVQKHGSTFEIKEQRVVDDSRVEGLLFQLQNSFNLQTKKKKEKKSRTPNTKTHPKI